MTPKFLKLQYLSVLSEGTKTLASILKFAEHVGPTEAAGRAHFLEKEVKCNFEGKLA